MIVVLANVVVIVPASRLSDRIGRKPVIFAACAGGALGSAIIALAPSIPIAMVGAAIFGAANGTFLAVDWALMTDIIPRASAGRYMGMSNVATGLGHADLDRDRRATCSMAVTSAGNEPLSRAGRVHHRVSSRSGSPRSPCARSSNRGGTGGAAGCRSLTACSQSPMSAATWTGRGSRRVARIIVEPDEAAQPRRLPRQRLLASRAAGFARNATPSRRACADLERGRLAPRRRAQEGERIVGAATTTAPRTR